MIINGKWDLRRTQKLSFLIFLPTCMHKLSNYRKINYKFALRNKNVGNIL